MRNKYILKNFLSLIIKKIPVYLLLATIFTIMYLHLQIGKATTPQEIQYATGYYMAAIKLIGFPLFTIVASLIFMGFNGWGFLPGFGFFIMFPAFFALAIEVQSDFIYALTSDRERLKTFYDIVLPPNDGTKYFNNPQEVQTFGLIILTISIIAFFIYKRFKNNN